MFKKLHWNLKILIGFIGGSFVDQLNNLFNLSY